MKPFEDGMRDVEYIGDGVYIGHDGFHLWLATMREDWQWHRIALDPSVFSNLCSYEKKLRIIDADADTASNPDINGLRDNPGK